jgi:hypothetical protein
MAHYAQLDENNIVIEIITGNDEISSDELYWENWYTQETGIVHKKTSFNTKGGVHIGDKTPFRKNYAGVGYYYDSDRDAFIPPKPFSSWQLNEETCLWNPPFNPPDNEKLYRWNEEEYKWDEIDSNIHNI